MKTLFNAGSNFTMMFGALWISVKILALSLGNHPSVVSGFNKLANILSIGLILGLGMLLIVGYCCIRDYVNEK